LRQRSRARFRCPDGELNSTPRVKLACSHVTGLTVARGSGRVGSQSVNDFSCPTFRDRRDEFRLRGDACECDSSCGSWPHAALTAGTVTTTEGTRRWLDRARILHRLRQRKRRLPPWNSAVLPASRSTHAGGATGSASRHLRMLADHLERHPAGDEAATRAVTVADVFLHGAEAEMPGTTCATWWRLACHRRCLPVPT